MIPWLGSELAFPPVETALTEPDGLLAAGGDLSARRLLLAYAHGIFPWFSPGDPILWWSPSLRMVIEPGWLRVTRSLEKTLRNRDYEIRIDSAFRAVMNACAQTPRPGQEGTWIVPEVIEAYCRLHALGHAHSVETWMDGQLVGGLYAVSLGTMVYGESMFSRVSDASKLAFVHLVRHLQTRGVRMIDCQMYTPHLASLGARLIPRAAFLDTVAVATREVPPPDLWTYQYSHDAS